MELIKRLEKGEPLTAIEHDSNLNQIAAELSNMLQKGGYSGTAQDLKNTIESIRNIDLSSKLDKVQPVGVQDRRFLIGANGMVVVAPEFTYLQEIEDLNYLIPRDAVFSSSVSFDTGAIKIRLPQSRTDTNIQMSIRVMDFDKYESFSMTISCNTGSTVWVGIESVQIYSSLSSKNFAVRFGHDGTKCCIYIGELNSVWRFPKVIVDSIFLSGTNTQGAKWLTGWNISLERKAFQGVDLTSTNNLPISQ